MLNHVSRARLAFFTAWLLLPVLRASAADDMTDVLRLENQVAWCIVPFDAAKRGPAERAEMLHELGIKRCAYDWREEHVPSFEAEILEYKKHDIEFFAFWGVHEDALRLFEKYDLHPQIWQMIGEPNAATQAEKVELAAQEWLPLAKRLKTLGCKLCIYNHGGWGGEPKNMVAICQRLHQLGQEHVGIAYNFHHGHGHIEDWAESFRAMQPFLFCLNLNGMNLNEQPKILGIGQGTHELDMIRVVVEEGYKGPIGILDHREQLDARDSLIENRDGLAWIRQELTQPGSGGPKPVAPLIDKTTAVVPNHVLPGHVLPGANAYRQPPITVEIRAKLHSKEQYNILVACDTKQSSDHWELFSMAGTGNLTAYLPGMNPDHVRSTSMICDGQWHTITMHYAEDRLKLFVDSRQVADQQLLKRDAATQVPGALAIGRLVEGGFGCNGNIDWVRISKGISDLPVTPPTRVDRSPNTIAFWDFNTAKAETGLSTATNLEDSNLASTDTLYDAELVQRLAKDAGIHGDAVRGAAVFTSDKLACISCHQVGDQGGKVGPALSALAKERTVEHLIESLLWPSREVKPEYMTWQVLTSEDEILVGYKHSEDSDSLTLRDPTSNKLTTLAHADIEHAKESGTVMPTGLFAAMTSQQQLDLIRFLSEMGKHGAARDKELEAAVAHSQMRGPAEFPITTTPLAPDRWGNSGHFVTRDRLYDFYSKQAEHFRGYHPMPMLLAPFPGLDGGKQGHWGNQNEEVWADGRWNETLLGSVQSGVFIAEGLTVTRGICLRLGEQGELSACFNPDTLSYEAVWSGGFVRFDAFRHGFVSGLRQAGVPVPFNASKPKASVFSYHGFFRHGNRVVFSYTLDGIDYLDAPWVKDGQFINDVAPASTHRLRNLLEGGPAQWPQSIETKIIPGTGRPYAIDTIELPYANPWKAPLFCGGHDFLPDGSALVCTMQGDVWHVSGLQGENPQTGKARWRRFASGLHHPLGLVVSNGNIYVQCRDQLARLEDRNGDGEADFYACHSNAFETSPAGHDYICGLQRDELGNFYTASGNQGLVRISPDGKKADVLATGFRNPDGLGILPDGSITVPVSEGEWTPASAINLVPHASQLTASNPLHFGYRGPHGTEPPALPLAYIPRGLDNSSGGQVYVSSDAFGPLKGQLLHLSFGAGAWFAVLQDEVAGQPQGAIVPLSGDFLSGAHRGRFNPVDGQLYVSGMAGWGSYTPDDGCFQRVRFTGDDVQVPIGFHTFQNGVRVTFANPIDAKRAADLEQQFAQCWNYRYSGAYGSVEYSTLHPGVAAHDPLVITSVQILPDGHSLFLEIPDLQPVSQLHLRLNVDLDTSFSCSPTGSGHDLFITVHRLDNPFTEFDNYEPREKTVAAHPLLSDLVMNSVRVDNPWTQPISGAREITMETGKNLTFATPELTVHAGEALAFALANPDVVPHNWVLVQRGTLKQVGELANKLIAQPEAYARQYVPESDDVLVHTDIVPPGEKQLIYFHAPTTPGRYPYLCTFPGHWMVMNGVMIVK